MSNETTTIPLNKLAAWDGNVRKTDVNEAIDELAASIASHGLLQSLVVKKGKRGKYDVIAGQRRLIALQKLASDKTIAKDTDIPCVIAASDADAAELSLAENVIRMPMHPADQFEAFRDLIDNGASVPDVAARFGVSETLVVKRMKLGRVSPVILDIYREGKVGLDLVQAFAVSDDQEAQEHIWNDLPAWDMYPRTIKRLLTEGEIPASDKRVRLVGLDAYEAAGGTVRRDLFDPEDGGTVLDAELLDNLVAKMLEEAADKVRSERWLWVQIRPEIEYGDLQQFDRVYPEDVALSDEDQAELDRLTAEYDELVDTDDDDEIARLEEIDRRIDELTEAAKQWSSDALAMAGAIVSIGMNGEIRIERGLVRPDDRPVKSETGKSGDSAPAAKLSAKLIEDLSAQKSAAISAELSQQPDVALAAIVHTLSLQVFYRYAWEKSCLQISVSRPNLRGSQYSPDSCKALITLETEHERWRQDVLPEDPTDLWTWCCEQPRSVLLDSLALIAALSVNAVIPKNGHANQHVDALANAVSLDMADHFTPTADNFFKRINGAGIIAAISEAKGVTPAPTWSKMKKAELASVAERQVSDTGWLPEPLRIAKAENTEAVLDELPEAAE